MMQEHRLLHKGHHRVGAAILSGLPGRLGQHVEPGRQPLCLAPRQLERRVLGVVTITAPVQIVTVDAA